MSSTKEPKPTSWPWIVTAWLAPLLIAGIVAVWYIGDLRSKHEPRIAVAEAKINRLGDRLAPRISELTALIDKTGFLMTAVSPGVHATSELDRIPVQLTEEPTPVQNRWSAFIQKARNGDREGVAAMRAARDTADRWSALLNRVVAVRVYNDYYGLLGADAFDTPPTNLAFANEVAKLRRQTPTMSDWIANTAAMQEAGARYSRQEPGLDPRAPVGGTTIEDIVSLQRDLIRQLSTLSRTQAADAVRIARGWQTFHQRRQAVDGILTRLQNDLVIGENDAVAQTAIAKVLREINARRLSETGATETVWQGALYSGVNAAKDDVLSDIRVMGTDFDNEIRNHQRDAFEFQRLLQENKKVGNEAVLSSATKPDAKVVWVNREAKLCHIDIGSSDNVHAGMRFEIWNASGRGQEYLKAMVEVIRPISPGTALCSILDSVEHDDPVREGDSAINILWDNGRYLRVALHGALWDAEHTRYGKFRLRQLLEDLGVTVADKLDTRCDAVILGAGWVLDPHYNQVRESIRVDTYSEQRVRLYVDPR
jgi:hypothetical protein